MFDFSIQEFKILKTLILSLTETLIFSHVVGLNETTGCLTDIQTLTVVIGKWNPGVTGGKFVSRAHMLAHFSCMALSVRDWSRQGTSWCTFNLYPIYFLVAKVVTIKTCCIKLTHVSSVSTLVFGNWLWKLSPKLPLECLSSPQCCLHFNITYCHCGFIPLFSCPRNPIPRLKSCSSSCLFPE